MKDIRIGNDVSVVWSLYHDQEPFTLEGLNVALYLKGMYGETKIEDFTIRENQLLWTFLGKEQKGLGKYSLALVINEGKTGMVTTDTCDFIRLVSCTCNAGGADDAGVHTETIALQSELELAGGFTRIDNALNAESENAVSNAVITAEFGKVKGVTDGLQAQVQQVGNVAGNADAKATQNAKALVGKQDVINDLDTIRAGALKGATALQEHQDISHLATKQELAGKVSKEEGKGLSTNDYTDEDKSKLEGLDNYDDSEVKQSIKEVRESIANIKPAPMVSVTYSELVELRNKGELIAGMQYRITDYVTTTAQENTRSAGHPFDVIVTADSADKLNEVARVACIKEFDIKRYYRGFSPTWDEAMTYVGLYEHNGKTYYQYMSASEDLQMLVDFTENVEYADTVVAIVLQYPFWIKPSYARYYEDGDWQEWDTGEVQGEIVGFNANPDVLYFHNANAKMEAWKIWYCLDNDTGRFAWADAENGKGVIYRMIDEFGNDCPYDFKNVMFKRNLNFDNGYAEFSEDGEETWVYTFAGQSYHIDNYVWSGMLDGSLESPFGHQSDENFSTFHSNIIKPYIKFLDDINDDRTKTGIRYLNDNVFLGYWEKIGSTNEEDAPYYYPHCCFSNRLGNNCFSNSFNRECFFNTFGNGCYSNTFGNCCFFNTFGNDCSCNTFGNDCSYNTFGSGCNSNTFGNGCYSNTFGNCCFFNTFEDDEGFAHNVQHVILENGVDSIRFYYDDTPNTYRVIQNIHVYSGVKNDDVFVPADSKTATFYAVDAKGVVHSFNILDFKNS